MLKRCGPKCFLDPVNLKYPVCNNRCKIDQRGVQAAYMRARQYHNNSIANKARRLKVIK